MEWPVSVVQEAEAEDWELLGYWQVSKLRLNETLPPKTKLIAAKLSGI